MFLPAGYVKLEGATVNRENYPRLVALADSYNLWTSDTAANPGLFGEGDGSTTMVLPNWTGRMAQFAATAGSAIAAGLPNIGGSADIGIGSSTGVLNAAGLRASSGAFAPTGNTTLQGFVPQNSVPAADYGVRLDASRSNSIYSASQTVQPPAINVFAIMRY